MPHRAPLRRWTRLAGIALALVGLGLLGYVAWQYWGTTWVSRAKQQRIVEQLEENWANLPADRAQRPDGEPASTDDEDGDEGAAVHVSGTTAGAILRIPTFGSSYAVPILEGTSSDVLSAGVGHFPESAGVGEVGNYALAAHRVTHGEPFRDLPDLEAGDSVVIDTAEWRYTYVLDTDGDDLEVAFTEGWVVDAIPHNPDGGLEPSQTPGQRLITLTTCAELFHTDERLVAFGHLVQRTARR